MIDRYLCPKRVFFTEVSYPGRGLGFDHGSPLAVGLAQEYRMLKSCSRALRKMCEHGGLGLEWQLHTEWEATITTLEANTCLVLWKGPSSDQNSSRKALPTPPAYIRILKYLGLNSVLSSASHWDRSIPGMINRWGRLGRFLSSPRYGRDSAKKKHQDGRHRQAENLRMMGGSGAG